MKTFHRNLIAVAVILSQVFFALKISAQNNVSVDLSKVKFVKYGEEKLSKADTANSIFFYPENIDTKSCSNLANVIINAALTSKINVYETAPIYNEKNIEIILDSISIKNILGFRIDTTIEINPETDELQNVINIRNIDSEEITYFILHYLKFFDFSDNLIFKQIIGISPVREWNNVYDDYMRRKVFYLKTEDISPYLINNNGVSYSDLILSNKYVADTDIDFTRGDIFSFYKDSAFQSEIYINIAENPMNMRNLSLKTYFIQEKIKAQKFENAEIVYVKVKKEGENLQLFNDLTYNTGYKSLIDIILPEIFKNNYSVFINSDFKEKADTLKLKKLLGERFDSVYVTTEYYDSDNRVFYYEDSLIVAKTEYNTQEIVSYVFKELWTYDKKGKTVSKQILGICPVREFWLPEFDNENSVTEELFWIKYSDFLNLFKSKNINKISNSADQTYSDFFKNNRYVFEIKHKEYISKNDALKIIESIK